MFAATLALVAWLVLVPAAVAQEEQYTEEQVEQQLEEQIEAPIDVQVEEGAEEEIQAIEEQLGESAEVGAPPAFEELVEQQAEQQGGEPVEITVREAGQTAAPGEQAKAGGAKQIPKTGGLTVGSALLPAAALLLGSGILAYAVLRRR